MAVLDAAPGSTGAWVRGATKHAPMVQTKPVAPVSLPLSDPTLLRQANCIDGRWVQADAGATLAVRNPATGDVVGEVPAMGAAETRRAIDAAKRALPAWRRMLARERAVILRALFDLMNDHLEDLAVIMTAEQGKPLAESRGEIRYAASFIEWFAEEGKRVYGDTIPQNEHGRRILVLKSAAHYRAAFEPIASEVIEVDAPGISSPRLETFTYVRLRRPIYPLDPSTTWSPAQR